MPATPRILTTHVGSLPRPADLLAMMRARADGGEVDAAALHARLAQAVGEVVVRQVEIGIDIVSDGEFSKPSYATYVTDRLSGFNPGGKLYPAEDLRDFRAYAEHLIASGAIIPTTGQKCCDHAVALKDRSDLDTDLANFTAAIGSAKPHGAFMTAPSPGVIAVFQSNRFYTTEEAYLEAVGEAMRTEYEAIVAAGFMLQIDSPDLAMSRHMRFAKGSDEDFVAIVERNVAALNHALRDIPADRVRMHVCWGNYAGPHHRDIPLAKILPAILRAKPHAIALEGANPRHGHEWAVFEDIKLPADKILIPGVIDSTSNFIEHPELVAQRILRYAEVVGPDRVQAGTDCGFSTFGESPSVFPDIVWKKLDALVQGARLAAARL